MTRLRYKIRDNSSPGNKPRVYFSCHPDDVKSTFSALCDDILKACDCLIYYKEDMADELPEDTRELDLLQMNLFVFPITLHLLQEDCPAVHTDLAFAKTHGKRILPIVCEQDTETDLFSLLERLFGKRQAVGKYSTDTTEIPYALKLKRHLEALAGMDFRNAVKDAFSASIFLSYRKKDRLYANELMRMIHSMPECRDIAVWYDEFLIPGEDYEVNIAEALNESGMVLLLVTPSLLEPDANGNANFVQRVEYPEAKRSGKPILPAEKVPTNREALARDYEGLPVIVDAGDETQLQTALLEYIGRISKKERLDTPWRDYLLGRAYYEGVNMEVNEEYGIALLTKAAEAGVPEAMDFLFQYYFDLEPPLEYDEEGDYWYATEDYKETAGDWIYRKYLRFRELYGESDRRTLAELERYAAYQVFLTSKLAEAIDMYERSVEIRKNTYGENDRETIAAMYGLADAYDLYQFIFSAGLDPEKIEATNLPSPFPLWRKCYQLSLEQFGSKDPDTLLYMDKLIHETKDVALIQQALVVYDELIREKTAVLSDKAPEVIDYLRKYTAYYEMISKY